MSGHSALVLVPVVEVGNVRVRVHEFEVYVFVAVSAGEAVWMSVPNAFPGGATSAAGVLGEDDLGGAVFRVKVLIGR